MICIGVLHEFFIVSIGVSFMARCEVNVCLSVRITTLLVASLIYKFLIKSLLGIGPCRKIPLYCRTFCSWDIHLFQYSRYAHIADLSYAAKVRLFWSVHLTLFHVKSSIKWVTSFFIFLFFGCYFIPLLQDVLSIFSIIW